MTGRHRCRRSSAAPFRRPEDTIVVVVALRRSSHLHPFAGWFERRRRVLLDCGRWNALGRRVHVLRQELPFGCHSSRPRKLADWSRRLEAIRWYWPDRIALALRLPLRP